MKKLLSAALLLTATLAFAKDKADSKVKVHDQDHNGNPTFVTGDMGKLGPGSDDKAAKDFLKGQKDLLNLAGTEDFEAIGTRQRQATVSTHVSLQEKLSGLPVFGAEYIVHADAQRQRLGMNGRFAPDRDLPRNPSRRWLCRRYERARRRRASRTARTRRRDLRSRTSSTRRATPSWRGVTTHRIRQRAGRADRHRLRRRDARATSFCAPRRYQRARNRSTYNGNNGTSLPGTLDADARPAADIGDPALYAAHDHAGNVLRLLQRPCTAATRTTTPARRSRPPSTTSVAYNNAFWNGSQMVYGDGDGTQFIAARQRPRRRCARAHARRHHLQRQPDLLERVGRAQRRHLGHHGRRASKRWKDGAVSADTWKVGEDITTPGTSGDALRYMNNPTAGRQLDGLLPGRATPAPATTAASTSTPASPTSPSS